MPTKRRQRFGMPRVLVLAIALTSVLPALAIAQSTADDPTAAVYDDAEGTTASLEASDPGAEGDTSGLSSPIGSLPFTGMDLIILAGVALVLTGTGFALRSASMRRGPQPRATPYHRPPPPDAKA